MLDKNLLTANTVTIMPVPRYIFALAIIACSLFGCSLFPSNPNPPDYYAVPNAPSNLTATVNTATIDLHWQDNSDNELLFVVRLNSTRRGGTTIQRQSFETPANTIHYTLTDTNTDDYLYTVTIEAQNYTDPSLQSRSSILEIVTW